MEAVLIPSPSTLGLIAVARYAVGVHTVECDGFSTKTAASKYARQLNERYQADSDAAAIALIAPEDRKIPTGFYTDADAR